jgi:hypothetical protein
MARGGQDVIGFTRIFVLFCTLVLAPALFMSGFGVIAILNEREAEKLRRYEEANELLRAAERAFADALHATDRAALARLEGVAPADAAAGIADLRQRGRPIGTWAIFFGDDVVGEEPFASGPPRRRLAELAHSAVRERVVHVPLEQGEIAGVVSMQRLSDDDVLVYALDEDRLLGIIRRAVPHDELTVRLRISSDASAPVINAVERLMNEVLQKQAMPNELVVEAPFDR